MASIPDEKVREVRERAGILEVVSEYVSLKRTGSNWSGLCPFHQEKTPSFTVNPAKGIYHCFGCGAGGDIFAFVMRLEGLAFPEAVRLLGKKVGVVIEDRPPTAEEQRRQDEREQLLKVAEVAAAFYRQVLQQDPAAEAARSYLLRRGVDAETAATYRLGYAPDRWDALVRYLEGRRLPLELAAKLGLVRRRESGGYYDLFRNRLLFVIADLHGRPIAFGGRVLDDSLPKYINSPESLIYRKGEVLFGLDLAKPTMREQGSVLIVEGYFDQLALYRAGVKNAVATCGTALTVAHARLLKRYADKVYLLFDADKAGRAATFKAMEVFLEEGVPAFAVTLPNGEDPDTFLATEGGVAAFATLLARAVPAFELFLRELVASHATGSVPGQVQVVDELLPRLAKIADPLQRNLWLREAARLLGIEERHLAARLRPGRPADSPVQAAPRPAPRRGGIGPEEMLLCLMGRFPEVVARVADHGVAQLFGEDLAPLATALVAASQGGELTDWTGLLARHAPPDLQERLSALLVADGHLDEVDLEKAFDQCLQSRTRGELKQASALRRELLTLDPEHPRYMEIVRQLEAVRNRKSQLQ